MPLEIAMRVLASDLNFPTSLAFDSEGVPYVAESGLPLDGAPRGGRVLRLPSDGPRECLVRDLRAPVTGLVFLSLGRRESGSYLAAVSERRA